MRRECGGDDELRARVEALLKANDDAPLPEIGAASRGRDSFPTQECCEPGSYVGQTIAGRYKLIEMIGEGGMGTAARLTEAGNLTLAGGALKFDLAPSGASDLADVNNLSLGAAAIAINMPAGSLSNGSYDLINYSGSLSGSASTLMLSGAASGPVRQSFTLVTSASSAGSLLLQVAGSPASLVWTGSQSGTWDTSSLNWSNSGAADKFYNNDSVTFNDTAATASVTLNSSLQPQSVLFNNNLLNYTLSGSGGLSTASFTKTGSGMLTLNAANIAGGNFTVGGGTLQIAGGLNVVAKSICRRQRRRKPDSIGRNQCRGQPGARPKRRLVRELRSQRRLAGHLIRPATGRRHGHLRLRRRNTGGRHHLVFVAEHDAHRKRRQQHDRYQRWEHWPPGTPVRFGRIDQVRQRHAGPERHELL